MPNQPITWVSRSLSFLLRKLIRGYQICLSPFVGMHCRFHPSCSHYAMESLEKHGFGKGSYLALHRLLRCHPWSEGGCDPVPEVSDKETELPKFKH